MEHQEKPIGTGHGNTNNAQSTRKKYRQWFLTINNDVMNTISQLKKMKYTYLHITCERGTLAQHFHAHAHVKFFNARHFGGIKSMLPNVNISHVRNEKATHDYIMKEKTWAGYRFLYEKGHIVYEINEIEKMNKNTYHNKQLAIYNEAFKEATKKIEIMKGGTYTKEWIKSVEDDFMIWVMNKLANAPEDRFILNFSSIRNEDK